MASKEHWILDGYNVMHALHQIQSSLPFEVSRERFISWVEHFQALGDKQMTIVFDNNVHLEGPEELSIYGNVVYSPVGYNADGTILAIIRKTTPQLRPKIIVVTRDLMLRDAILALRCVVVSPEAFLVEFERYCHQSTYLSHRKKENKKISYQPFRDFFEK